MKRTGNTGNRQRRRCRQAVVLEIELDGLAGVDDLNRAFLFVDFQNLDIPLLFVLCHGQVLRVGVLARLGRNHHPRLFTRVIRSNAGELDADRDDRIGRLRVRGRRRHRLEREGIAVDNDVIRVGGRFGNVRPRRRCEQYPAEPQNQAFLNRIHGRTIFHAAVKHQFLI